MLVIRLNPSSATLGDVVVVGQDGATITSVDAFTYLPQGEITLASPNRGQYGTFVSLYGHSLLGGGTAIASVTLNEVVVLDVLEVIGAVGNVTQIRLRAALSSTTGVGDIRIEADTGAIVELDNGWTYDTPSNITDVCIQSTTSV